MIRKIKNLIPLKVRCKIVTLLNTPLKLRSKKLGPKYKKSINNSRHVLNGQIAYNKYGGYFTPIVPSKSAQEGSVIFEILNGDTYEPDTIKFMRDNCSNGDIIHAGTFFGDFLPGLSSSLSKESKIWAFEPDKDTFRCAQITTIINDLKNVELINFGLGDKTTMAKLLTELETGKSLGGASKIISEDTNGKIKEVNLVRIDDIIPKERSISILQLDVEGFEKEALSGAIETINRCKPILILEDNNKIVDSSWFSENILSVGYELTGNLHRNNLLTIKSLHNVV
jgi:FkbM family methyltransferase